MQERVRLDGRTVILTWLPNFRLQPVHHVTQVYGLSFTSDRRLLLVSPDGMRWTLSGGHPEGNEAHEATLRCEVREEACARVTACRYLGAQRVDDPTLPAPHYQLRYLARVALASFRPRHEMRHRTLDPLTLARRRLWGGNSRIAHALFDLLEANETLLH